MSDDTAFILSLLSYLVFFWVLSLVIFPHLILVTVLLLLAGAGWLVVQFFLGLVDIWTWAWDRINSL